MIEKVTLNEAMSALQAGTSVNNIIGLSGSEGRKITPANLLPTMGTERLIKRVAIPRQSNVKWTRVLEVPNNSGCLFTLELCGFYDTSYFFIVGAMKMFNNQMVHTQFSNLLDIPVQNEYTPSIRYKKENDKAVLWAKSPANVQYGYVSVWFGSPSFPMTLETPPDDALKPGFITT